MLSGVYNIRCDQGSTLERVITVTQSDGTPVDLSGYSARMQVRRRLGSEDTLLDLTTEGGEIVLGGEDGTIAISISATQTAEVPRSGVYDLELVNGPTVTKILRGQFILQPEVTQ